MKNLSSLVVTLLLVSSPSFAQVGINTDGSAADPSAGLDVKFTNKGLLPPRMTLNQMNAIVDPASGLIVFCTDCGTNGSGAMSMFINGMWFVFNANCLTPGSPITGVHTPSADQIVWNWNPVAWATGYKWNITNDYSSATNMAAATTKTETALACGSAYTRYVWAYNTCGNSSAVSLTQSTNVCCGTDITINHIAGIVSPVTKSVTYGIVTSIPGEPAKCWITSNLGSDHQATAVNDATESSAGWYWQFNRKQGYKHDGTTRTPNTTWITLINENSDWVASNDPCIIELGASWRVPTYNEWNNVFTSGNWTNWNGPWNSGLKLHAAGSLDFRDGSLGYRGSNGNYWSSTQNSSNGSRDLYFLSGGSNMGGYLYKAHGITIRCLRD